MFYPYSKLDKKIQISYSPFCNGTTTVLVQQPTESVMFNTVCILVPGYTISNLVGFTQDQVNNLIEYCRSHEQSLLKVSRMGVWS